MEPVTTIIEDEQQVTDEVLDRLAARIYDRQVIETNRKSLSGMIVANDGKLIDRDDVQKKASTFFGWARAHRDGDLMRIKAYHDQFTNDYNSPRYKTLSPQIEGTNSAGGYLVPPEYAADVLMLLQEMGYARRYCNKIQMNEKVLNVSTLIGKPTVGWYAENTAIGASKGTFGQLILTLNKMAALYPISNELLDDANVDVYVYITRVIAEAIAIEEDTQIFRGTGSPFTGVLSITAEAVGGVDTSKTCVVYQGNSSTSGKTAYSDITWDDVFNLVNGLPISYQRDAKVFIDQNVWNVLLQKKDSAGNYLDMGEFFRNPLNGEITIKGVTIVVVPTTILIAVYDTAAHVSTKHVICANLKTAAAWLGEKGGVVSEILREGTADGVSALTNDLQFMRIKERIAFGVGLPKAITVLSTAAS